MQELETPEIQMFASAAIVRQSSRIPLPERLVDYHKGLLEEMGVDLLKIQFMESEQLAPILPDVLQLRRFTVMP